MNELFEARRMAPKMLIADDDPAIVSLLADRCTAMGFEVETASNGIQALIMARRSNPDVLIIDNIMPEADGISVCARLLDSHDKPGVIVVMTGNPGPQTVERCESLGMYYAHKGPGFWSRISSALTQSFPHLTDRIEAVPMPSADIKLRTRSRVLLIDDDPDIEVFLSSRLDKFGVDTLYAGDGMLGYRMACRELPNVIISDYFMPTGDVHFLLWRLRSTRATRLIPVFVLSGRKIDEPTAQSLKREVCGAPGVARVFRKSFDTKELFDALRKFCILQTKDRESDADRLHA